MTITTDTHTITAMLIDGMDDMIKEFSFKGKDFESIIEEVKEEAESIDEIMCSFEEYDEDYKRYEDGSIEMSYYSYYELEEPNSSADTVDEDGLIAMVFLNFFATPR